LVDNIITASERFAEGDPVIFGQGGDIVNGSTFNEPLVKAGSVMHNQISLACQLYDEFAKRLNIAETYIAYGTDVHVFGDGSAEELVAKHIRDTYHKPAIAEQHPIINIDGFLLNLSHHGSATGDNWTQDSPARMYLLRQMSDDMDIRNKKPAGMYARGHVHGYAKAYGRMMRSGKSIESWLYIMPSMCLMNSHARKVTRSKSWTVHGALLFEVLDGELGRVKPLLKYFDATTSFTVGNNAYGSGKYSQGDGQMG